jgi:2'-5' RNA ligase
MGRVLRVVGGCADRGVDEATLKDVQASARDLTLRWTADRLVLFRSYTDPHGSIYEELATYPLTGAPESA